MRFEIKTEAGGIERTLKVSIKDAVNIEGCEDQSFDIIESIQLTLKVTLRLGKALDFDIDQFIASSSLIKTSVATENDLKTLYNEVTPLSIKDFLKFENIEIRRLMFNVFDNQEVVNGLDAELIASETIPKNMPIWARDENGKLVKKHKVYKDTYTLYAIPHKVISEWATEGNVYYLQYTCPTTGRVYMEAVPPKIGETRNPLDCIAWMAGAQPVNTKQLIRHGDVVIALSDKPLSKERNTLTGEEYIKLLYAES